MKENENEKNSENNDEINTKKIQIEEKLIKKNEDKENLEQDMYAVFINNPLLNDKQENNKTNTSRYRWFNFLAKILREGGRLKNRSAHRLFFNYSSFTINKRSLLQWWIPCYFIAFIFCYSCKWAKRYI